MNRKSNRGGEYDQSSLYAFIDYYVETHHCVQFNTC
jgi:hypothetical protein